MVRPRDGRAFALGALSSLAIHAAVMLLILPSAAAPEPAPYQVEVEAAGIEAGSPAVRARGDAPADAERPTPGGARPAQNVDAPDRGQRGDATGDADAIRLMQRVEDIVLFDSPLNNLAAAQTQRIRTARDRATLERRRATPNPHDAPFLASGPGDHQERRPVSAADGAAGARRAPEASVEGGRPAPELTDGPGGEALARTEAARAGAEPSPGVGILHGEGTRRSEAARVDHARPPVDRGPAATQAENEDSRVRDEDDAELLARSMMQSWVESTTRSGAREGDGRGGIGGGGAPGSGGGRRAGGRAASYGPGDGSHDALDTSDARYRRWFLASRRRVHDALRFPQARALAMDQGVSVYMITVRRDGSLASAPRLVRPSGFEDMDRAALAAIRAATPFSPLPDDLAPGRDALRIRLPIEFENPMVR